MAFQFASLGEPNHHPIVAAIPNPAEEPVFGQEPFQNCVRNFFENLKEDSSKGVQLKNLIGERKLQADIQIDNFRNMLDVGSLTLGVLGEGGKQVGKLLNLFDEIEALKAKEILSLTEPHVKEVSELLSLGSHILSLHVLKKLMERLDDCHEELSKWKNIHADNQDAKADVDTLIEKLNIIKEECHEKCLSSKMNLTSKSVEVGLATTEYVLEEVINHAANLSLNDIEILKLAQGSLKALTNPLTFAVKLHEIYHQKVFLNQLKLLDEKKYSAKIHEIEESIAKNQVKAAKYGIKSMSSIVVKSIEILNHPTVAKVSQVSTNILTTLSKAAVVTNFIEGTVGLGFKVYSLIRNVQNYKKLKGRIGKIETHANKNTSKITDVGKDILQAKVHHLKGKKIEERFSIAKKSIKILTGILALASGAGGILAVTGAIVGTTAMAVLSATGIGAAALGAVVAAMSIAYVIYKNRYYGEYIANTWKLPFKRCINAIKISHANRVYRNTFGSNSPQQNAVALHATIAQEVAMRTKIQKLENEKKQLINVHKTATDILELRKLQSQLKGWKIQDFESLAIKVRAELETEEGRAKIENMLAKYNFTYIEDLSFATVLKFIIADE